MTPSGPLIRAAESAMLSVMRFLLIGLFGVLLSGCTGENVIDRHFRDVDASAVHVAVWNGGVSAVNDHLSKEAVNKCDKDGRTPLHYACITGNIAIVNRLIGLGAELTCADKRGLQPIHVAALNGHASVLSYLVLKGVPLECQDVDGNTPLLYAVMYGRLDAARILIATGANVDARNRAGETPFLVAVMALATQCRFGSLSYGDRSHYDRYFAILTRLAQACAYPFCKNVDGKTALDIAREVPLNDVIDLLNKGY